MSRTNFTPEQRAEIFALDRATCTYSGRSLWIADFGMDPIYQIDWADHIVPASRGGASTVKNGAAAGYHFNYLRGNDRQRFALYHRGLPTIDHAVFAGAIDADVMARLEKFAALTKSDWFLNRAMWHVWIAAFLEYERRAGKQRSRDHAYYAVCAWNALSKWRRMAQASDVEPLEGRKLVSARLEPDQVALLGIRDAQSSAEILELIHQLYPVFEASARLIDRLGEAGSPREVDSIQKKAEASPRLPSRIRARVLDYGDALRRLLRTKLIL